MCSEEKPYTGGNIHLPKKKHCRLFCDIEDVNKIPTSVFSPPGKLCFPIFIQFVKSGYCDVCFWCRVEKRRGRQSWGKAFSRESYHLLICSVLHLSCILIFQQSKLSHLHFGVAHKCLWAAIHLAWKQQYFSGLAPSYCSMTNTCYMQRGHLCTTNTMTVKVILTAQCTAVQIRCISKDWPNFEAIHKI